MPLAVLQEKLKSFSEEYLDELSKRAGIRCLPVKSEHCIELKTLVYDESAPHPHKDPFDRILICQAKAENMLLMGTE